MGIFDKFRKKKKEDAPLSQSLPASEGGKETAAPVKSQVVKDMGLAYQILLRPVLSEKGTHLAGGGKYVFVVHSQANKSEIRKSIQAVYNVHVRDVKILKMPAKSRRYGRTVGQTSAFKKAIVSLRAGEKIPGIIEAVG